MRQQRYEEALREIVRLTGSNWPLTEDPEKLRKLVVDVYLKASGALER